MSNAIEYTTNLGLIDDSKPIVDFYVYEYHHSIAWVHMNQILQIFKEGQLVLSANHVIKVRVIEDYKGADNEPN